MNPNRSSNEHDQSEKFKQAARELGVELDEEKLKEALRKIAPVQHASDCAVHNGPAYEAGPCDCGATPER